MIDFGFDKIALIGAVALIVIGPEKLPRVARTVGTLLGKMMSLSPKLMLDLGVTNGYRHLINTGVDGRQEVQHVHLHVMGGPRPWAKG